MELKFARWQCTVIAPYLLCYSISHSLTWQEDIFRVKTQEKLQKWVTEPKRQTQHFWLWCFCCLSWIFFGVLCLMDKTIHLIKIPWAVRHRDFFKVWFQIKNVIKWLQLHNPVMTLTNYCPPWNKTVCCCIKIQVNLVTLPCLLGARVSM